MSDDSHPAPPHDEVSESEVIRLTPADQKRVATILAASPRFAEALERAFVAHRELIRRSS
ncbi:MAG TPA: hypothetical protein VJ724_09925 [Tahibacter sp.]|nr:hypothetical protein [Tahibacter sp.]